MNKVLPYVQGGLGLRLRIPTANEGAVTLGPEIGFVPTITAPHGLQRRHDRPEAEGDVTQQNRPTLFCWVFKIDPLGSRNMS